MPQGYALKKTVLYTVLIVFLLISILPIFWVVSAALKPFCGSQQQSVGFAHRNYLR
jgi:ABC-type glycerol-3-phosphate transport system permease component